MNKNDNSADSGDDAYVLACPPTSYLPPYMSLETVGEQRI
jgi:hypothetical protein